MDDRDEKYRARAEILKAMAHPSRLKMLDALQGGALCVGDLQEVVGSDLSTISRHLSVMRAAGLLSTRREGNQIFYDLRVPCVMKTLACIEAVLREDARTAQKLVSRAS
jgi:DNA-binding transcriptional ArsR family regulator